MIELRSGRFQARYSAPGAVPRAYVYGPLTFERKRDAQDWLTRQRMRLVDGVVRPQALAQQITLEAYARQWLEDRRSKFGEPLRPTTRRTYEYYLDNHVSDSIGRIVLPDLTRDMVNAWYRTLAVGRPTLRARTYAFVRTVLNSAVDDDIIAVNPCRIRGAGATRPATRKQLISPEQVYALAAAMPARLAVAIHLGAWGQLRSGEVLELRRGDYLGPMGAVSITRGVTFVRGVAVIGPPKTDAGVRAIALPLRTQALLEEHLKFWVGGDHDALLFPRAPGATEHLGHTAFDYYVKAAVRRAGLPSTFRFHWLRHTGLTLAAQAGATVAELQARAGHATPGAALLYQHATTERDRALAASLDRLQP
ncbi:tyrosine-type recombinase/integrase [Cellulomonas endophytica]|uniref:tyrosine-type recombinase/integrase n=1 Tax=Cellulomonas endophytica TaxID=2494735 RepID=UPI00196A99B7|nr:tyrosine-type recombinase/integrase [Cellulomonas endophytica]